MRGDIGRGDDIERGDACPLVGGTNPWGGSGLGGVLATFFKSHLGTVEER